jgi:DNA repair exonuclease SbcCD ATPase subunit
MRLSSLCRMTATFAFVALTAGLVYAQQDSSQPSTGDSLAEAARKARAEQKTEPKPKKVFTNDDMPSAPPPSTDASVKTATQPAGGQSDVEGPGTPEETANNPKSEAYWRKRFQKQHDKISQAEQELDLLQRELNKDQVQYYNDPQKALMQQHDRSDINDKTAKLDAKQKEIDSLKQGLSDLEDELRKAGGDPGWAR